MAKRKYPTTAHLESVSRPKTATYHAASVRYGTSKTTKDGLMEACFFGPMEEKAFNYLRAEVIAGTSEATTMVIRMDKVLMLFSGPPAIPDGTYPKEYRTSAALIARREQVEFWREYSMRLADMGIICIVFTDSQESMAYRWAERRKEYGHE